MNDDAFLLTFPDTAWAADPAHAPTSGQEAALERGAVLHFPQLPFTLLPQEQRFLDARWGDGRAKNISLRGEPPVPDGHGARAAAEVRGATGDAAELAELQAMVLRFRDQAATLVDRLFPHYRGRLRQGNTSFRPQPVEGREASWRKDDTRLHVDAFPSNPTRGVRLLRVFTNVNPQGKPRSWRVGEPFEDFARRFAPALKRPLPGASALLHTLGITKARRAEYDHLMLQLHDKAKADLDYQRQSLQHAVDFAPGSTWVVFSDQVLHAVMGGQHMMETTFYLDVAAQQQPATAPLKVLERLLGRPLQA